MSIGHILGFYFFDLELYDLLALEVAAILANFMRHYRIVAIGANGQMSFKKVVMRTSLIPSCSSLMLFWYSHVLNFFY